MRRFPRASKYNFFLKILAQMKGSLDYLGNEFFIGDLEEVHDAITHIQLEVESLDRLIRRVRQVYYDSTEPVSWRNR